MPKQNKNIKKQRLMYGLLLLALVIGLIYWFIPPVWKLSNSDFKVTVPYDNERGKPIEIGPQVKGWTRIQKISKHLLDAIIIEEDARFYQHHGLDFIEIEKSIDINFKEGRIARGASTITQQVIKMAFLTREKSFIRKAREAFGALLLEQLMGKDRILEWYVNLAEFGNGIYGISEAADHYFQIKPGQITLPQAINLVLVLPNPKVWSTGLRKKELTDFGQERFTQIADNMRQSRVITDSEWINLLAIGDFGKPVKDYDKLLLQYLQDQESKNDSDSESPSP